MKTRQSLSKRGTVWGIIAIGLIIFWTTVIRLIAAAAL